MQQIQHHLLVGQQILCSASNSIQSGCTPTSPGMTYTNYVDFLNDIFVAHGLTDYKAQVSLISKSVVNSNSAAGFYIIRPSTDTFSINTVSNVGSAYQLSYHENDLTLWDGSPMINYYGIDCNNINLVDGVVIEG